MSRFLDELAARRRFGMRPGLEAIRAVASALGNPQDRFASVHIAGTNGKGAVAAMIDACLREHAVGRVALYTSPHLVSINERFRLDGVPVGDGALEASAARVAQAVASCPEAAEFTFFEALTATAFDLFASAGVDWAVLETGLGGRLDATNICSPRLSVITRVGLDHCDWLGDTVEKIASEKAGIVKPGVPVVLGANASAVRDVVARRAREVGAPFVYAPEVASEADVPAALSLGGAFNRENAVTAIAALRTLGYGGALAGLTKVVWPGRFQRVGRFLIDGAHNPPAATALAASLEGHARTLIAGFCGDKDVDEVLRLLAPKVGRGFAVRTNNPRSLTAEETARRMAAAGIPAEPCASLAAALDGSVGETLVAGSLFLAGEALVALGGYPAGWTRRFDPAERLAR